MSSSYCLFTRIYQEESDEVREELILLCTNARDSQQFQASGSNLRDLVYKAQLNLPSLDANTPITTIPAPRTWSDAKFIDIPTSAVELVKFRDAYAKISNKDSGHQ